MDISVVAHNVLVGAAIGAASTLLGWLKSARPGKFSFKGAIFKLPAGIVIGIVATTQNMDFNDAFSWAAGLGIIEGVDNATKMILRRLFPTWGYFEGNEFPEDFKYDPATASSLIKIAEGKDIDRDAVIMGTEAFRAVFRKYLDTNDPMDKQMYDHLSYVTNQILQNVREHGWTNETFVDIGKILFRVFQVYRKYRNSKTDLSVEQWTEEIKTIIVLLQAAFKGASIILK